MSRSAGAVAALAGVLLMAVTGCGLGTGVREVAATAVDRMPAVRIDPPDARLADGAVVRAARASVVKVRGVATGCEKITDGSGFVVASHRVASTAHVVAGAESVSVEAGGARYDARVVSYDPERDIAILDVPTLRTPPLALAEGVVGGGSDAVLLGYPGGGDFVATPVRIRDVVDLRGPDIYRGSTSTREVYTIRGTVHPGDSGGPLVDLDGRALGLAFGAAVSDPDTGFVVTSREVAPQLANVGATGPVTTGRCLG